MNVVVETPAKINLRLKIVGRRDDGFHLLNMVNLPLALSDTVQVQPSKTDSLLVQIDSSIVSRVSPGEREHLSSVEKNLTTKVLKLFREKVAAVPPLSIHLTKRIPSGAGLGGGSSDGSAVWSMLCATYAKQLPLKEQRALVLPLGSDIPYFLECGPARVRGIGEEVEGMPVFPLMSDDCVLVVPREHAATPKVYELYRKRYPSLTGRFDALAEGSDLSRQEALALIDNDLEEPLCIEVPAVRTALEMLRARTDLAVGVTGSGSTIFCFSREGKTFSTAQREHIKAIAGKIEALVISTQIASPV